MSPAVETTRSLGMEVTGMERLHWFQRVEESLFSAKESGRISAAMKMLMSLIFALDLALACGS